MESLKITDLHKSYGSVKVLKGINFSLQEGEFLVLVGPSGCGKSTLLSLIAGLEEVSSGNIYFANKNITSVVPKERDLAMVFQSYALYPNMTVKENIEFGLKINKYSKEEIKKRIQTATSILHIDMLLDRKPAQLSGGQRQRVAIARAISREPSMYLFDEPLSNLDAELRVKMRAEINKLHKKVQKTMVYVTHDQIEAMTLADKVAVMHEGKIQQFDTPINIYNNPANLFTAGFMGSPSMNLIEVTIRKKDNKFCYDLISDDKVNTVFIDNHHKDLVNYIDKTVIAGIRPTHMQNGFREHSTSDNIQKLQVKVHFSELTGSDLFLHITLNNTEVISRVSSTYKVKIGENINLQIKANNTMFFDKTTEERIR